MTQLVEDNNSFQYSLVYIEDLHDKLIQITAQNMKFSIKDFFSKCDQIRSYLQIWSHLLKISLIENFIFCKVKNNDKSRKTPRILNEELASNAQKMLCVIEIS